MSEPVRINRPGEGGARKPKISNKWYWIGGGVGAIVIYWYYKKQKASAAAAQSTDTTGAITDTSGYGDFSNTGQDYSGLGYSSPYNYQPVNTFTPAPSNALWFQQALAFLVAQGYDPTTSGTALGKYLAGAGLTQQELNIVQAAIGAEGLPPSAPPPAHLEPPTSVVGPIGAPHMNAPKETKSGTNTIVTLSWSSVPGAVSYTVYRTTLPVAKVGGTSFQYVKKVGAVPYAVRAVDAQGKASQLSNVVIVP